MSNRTKKKKTDIPRIEVTLDKSGVTVVPKVLNGATNGSSKGLRISFKRKIGLAKGVNKSVHSTFFFDESKLINVLASSRAFEPLRAGILESRIALLDIIRKGKRVAGYLERLRQRLRAKARWTTRLFISSDTIAEFDRKIAEYEVLLEDLNSQFAEAVVTVDVRGDEDIMAQYQKVRHAYADLLNAAIIWDVISGSLLERNAVKFGHGALDFLHTDVDALVLENSMGSDLYVFPAFIVQVTPFGTVTITDLADLRFSFYTQTFAEEDVIPHDATVVDHNWPNVNKDGRPDRRYSEKHPIPVVQYGVLEFDFPDLTKKTYHVSNLQLAEQFGRAFEAYLAFFKGPQTAVSVNVSPLLVPQPVRLSDDVITLVKDITERIVALCDELKNDQRVFQNLADQDWETVAETTRMVLFHDLYHILNRLNPEQDDRKYLIACYVIRALLNREADINAIGVEEARRFIQQTEPNLQAMEKLISFASDCYQSTRMAFPPFLKANVSELHDTYKNDLYHFALVLAKADRSVSKLEKATLNILYTELSEPLVQTETAVSPLIFPANSKQPLEEILGELDILTGLDNVKQKVTEWVNAVQGQQDDIHGQHRKRTLLDLCHMVFTGNPGTGKTTVARIISKLYRALGVLSSGHLVKVNGTELVAEDTVGTTAKVNQVVDLALGGMLFVEGPYPLVSEGGTASGKAAIATLLKRLDTDRDRMAVVFAGSHEELQIFLGADPKLQAKVNNWLHFEDYTVDELMEIFMLRCLRLNYQLNDGALKKLHAILARNAQHSDHVLGNGRFVNKLFEQILEHHAKRIAGCGGLTKEMLTTIVAEDILG